MKRFLLFLLLINSPAHASLLNIGSGIQTNPSMISIYTSQNQNYSFEINISNTGTVSFPQIQFSSKENYITSNENLFPLKTGEEKAFKLTASTKNPGIFISEINFSNQNTTSKTKVIIFSSKDNRRPNVSLESASVNTLSSVNGRITIPQGENGTLYYGIINMTGSTLGVATKEVNPGDEIGFSISIPKEAIPGKYILFASVNQQSFSGEVFEVTTIISLPLLLLGGLLVVGFAILLQAGKLHRNEKLREVN